MIDANIFQPIPPFARPRYYSSSEPVRPGYASGKGTSLSLVQVKVTIMLVILLLGLYFTFQSLLGTAASPLGAGVRARENPSAKVVPNNAETERTPTGSR